MAEAKVQTGKMEFDHAKAFDQIRERWLSNLAHEISSPLFAARGYLRLALEEREGPLTESSKRYLDAALENIDKLVALSREFNESPSQAELQLTCFGFRDLLEEVLEAVRLIQPKENVRVTQELGSETITTVGDRQKLGEALQKFLLAAVQFTSPGGQVEVSTGEQDEKITFRLTATRASTTPGDRLDLSAPSRLWRLHGGNLSAHWSGERWSLLCELPLLRY